MDLDEGEGVRMLVVDRGVRRLDERALAGAAGAPQQYIVGREPGGEPLGVVEQDVADPVDSAQQADLDAVDLVNRLEPAAVGVPHEGIAARRGRLAGAAGGARRSSASAMRWSSGSKSGSVFGQIQVLRH